MYNNLTPNEYGFEKMK